MNWFDDLITIADDEFTFNREYRSISTLNMLGIFDENQAKQKTKSVETMPRWHLHKPTRTIYDYRYVAVDDQLGSVGSYCSEKAGYPSKIVIHDMGYGFNIYPYWHDVIRPHENRLYFSNDGTLDDATVGFLADDGYSRFATFTVTEDSNVNPLLSSYYKDDIVKIEMMNAMMDNDIKLLHRIVKEHELV